MSRRSLSPLRGTTNTRVKIGVIDGPLRWMSVPTDMSWEAFSESAINRFGSEAMKQDKSNVFFVCEGAEVDSVDLFRENDIITMQFASNVGSPIEDIRSPSQPTPAHQSPVVARPCTPPHFSPHLNVMRSPMYQNATLGVQSETFLVEVRAVCTDYDALPDGEQLTIRVGERVEVVVGEKSGWAYARNVSGAQGWVPGCCLGDVLESRLIPLNEQEDALQHTLTIRNPNPAVNRFIDGTHATSMHEAHITQPAAGSMPSNTAAFDSSFAEPLKSANTFGMRLCKNETATSAADSQIPHLSHSDSNATNDFSSEALRLNFTAMPFVPRNGEPNSAVTPNPTTNNANNTFNKDNFGYETSPPTDLLEESPFGRQNSVHNGSSVYDESQNAGRNFSGNHRKPLRPAGGEMITATGAVVTPMGASVVHREVRGASIGAGGYLVGYGKGGQLCERYHCTRCGLNELEKGCRMLPCESCHFARYCSEECTELDGTRHLGCGECRRFKQKVIDYNCAIWGSPAPPRFPHGPSSPTAKSLNRDISPFARSELETPTGARIAARLPKFHQQPQPQQAYQATLPPSSAAIMPGMTGVVGGFQQQQNHHGVAVGGVNSTSRNFNNNISSRWVHHADVTTAGDW